MSRKVIIISAAAIAVALYLRRRYAVQLAGRKEKAESVAPAEGEKLSIDVDLGEPVLRAE